MQQLTDAAKITRDYSRKRGLSLLLRTMHLVSFGILLGGHTFAIDADRLLPALYLTIASGGVLMTLEISTIGPHWLFMGKRATVLLKLLPLLAIPYAWDYRLPLLLLVVAIAVGSHMPGRYRHYSILQGRIVQSGRL
ncbi:MAG TPA: hypothetical protein VN444_02175 [Verrucomicrobiae bacterium]|nr:hypothetical protein [Verrucomicrobiae bacterium]